MLSWASNMTWKGLYHILSLSKTIYQKGISLTDKAMKQVESRLQRNPLLPKWDGYLDSSAFGGNLLKINYLICHFF
ncbi:MAG: hypothetical protein HRU34_23950 [Richelia sp.]|nr:hypothetical protein [Richelia sp.]